MITEYLKRLLALKTACLKFHDQCFNLKLFLIYEDMMIKFYLYSNYFAQISFIFSSKHNRDKGRKEGEGNEFQILELLFAMRIYLFAILFLK